LKTEIKEWVRELNKWIADLSEARSDEALPVNRRRARKVNIEADWKEKPWPRNYKREIEGLTTRITNKRRRERAFIDTREEKIRLIQQQHDFFDTLVEMLSNLQPQTCPVCLDDNVFQSVA
jgi:hypothetical protein